MNSRSHGVTLEDRARERIPSRGLQKTPRSTEFPLLSDEELVDVTRAGNHGAFDELVERYCAPVYGFALAVLKDENVAGDALCRAFVAALRDIDSSGAQCSPGAWLYLHGMRAVFQTLGPGPDRYSIVDRLGS